MAQGEGLPGGIEALLLEQSSDGVVAFDHTGQIHYANPAVWTLMDVPPGSVSNIFDAVHPDDLDRAAKSIAGVGEGARPLYGMVRVRSGEDRWRYVKVRPFALSDVAGFPTMTGAMIRDVGLTDAHWTFLARVAADQPLAVCFDELARGLSSEIDGPMTIAFTDDTGMRCAVGPVVDDLRAAGLDLELLDLGVSAFADREDHPGEPWLKAASSGVPVIANADELVDPHAAAAQKIGAAACVAMVVADPGSVDPVLIVQWPPAEAMAEILAEALVRRPREAVALALERRANQRRLEHLAHHDSLTGALNRGRFATELRRLATEGDSIGICYIDLDSFKPVNDTFGHDIGDRVLTECARRIEAVAGIDALVTRIGGDEFAVAFRTDDPEVLEDIAARLVKALALPIDVGERAVVVGASVGCAMSSDAAGPVDPDVVVSAADRALYDAKRNGGGTWSRDSDPLPFDVDPV